jgi:hypothetical protein
MATIEEQLAEHKQVYADALARNVEPNAFFVIMLRTLHDRVTEGVSTPLSDTQMRGVAYQRRMNEEGA